jgi:hypothetical protein
MKFWISEFMWRSYQFTAYAKTKNECEALIIRSWKEFCKQCPTLDSQWILQNWDSVITEEVELGASYCDYERINFK